MRDQIESRNLLSKTNINIKNTQIKSNKKEEHTK